MKFGINMMPLERSLLHPRKPTFKFPRFRTARGAHRFFIYASDALVPLNISDWSDVY